MLSTCSFAYVALTHSRRAATQKTVSSKVENCWERTPDSPLLHIARTQIAVNSWGPEIYPRCADPASPMVFTSIRAHANFISAVLLGQYALMSGAPVDSLTTSSSSSGMLAPRSQR